MQIFKNILLQILTGGLFTGFVTWFILDYFPKPYLLSIVLLGVLYFVLLQLNIIIHESSHLITAKRQGLSPKLFVISPFVFYKKEGRTAMQINTTTMYLFGGLLIPAMDLPQSAEEFSAAKAKLGKVYHSSVILNIILIILGLVTVAFILNFNITPDWSFFFLFAAVNLLFNNIKEYITSSADTPYLVGDKAAYNKILEDDIYAAAKIYEYNRMAKDTRDFIHSSDFLPDKLINHLWQVKDQPEAYTPTNIDIIDNFIYDFISDSIDELPFVVELYIKKISGNIRSFLSMPMANASYLMLVHHIIVCLCKTGHRIDALGIYNEVTSMLDHQSSPVTVYYQNRSAHVLGLQDERDFLNNPENLKYNNFSDILSLFGNSLATEKQINNFDYTSVKQAPQAPEETENNEPSQENGTSQIPDTISVTKDSDTDEDNQGSI